MVKRIKAYLQSMIFFFLIEGLLTFKWRTLKLLFTESFVRACYHILRKNSFSAIMLLLFVVDVVLLVINRRDLKKDTVFILSSTQGDTEEKQTYGYVLFFLTYIIPALLIFFFAFKGKLFVLFWLMVMGYVSANSSLYYQNPVLVLLGYKLDRKEDEKLILDSVIERFLIKDSSVKAFLDVKVSTYIKKHPVLVSLVSSTLITSLMLAAGLTRWETSDDFSMSQLMIGTAGESTPFVTFISYYLGIAIVWLEKSIPFVNWLTALELLSVWFSFIAMQWFLIKYGKQDKCWIGIIFPLLLEPQFLMSLQYTRSAFLLTFASLLLIYDATIEKLRVKDDAYSTDKSGKKRLFTKILQTCFGVFLFIVGSLFRLACMYISMAYVGLLFFVYFVSCLRKRCIKQNVTKTCYIIFAVIIAFGSSLYISSQNKAVYEDWDETNGYRSFNAVRAKVSDYLPSVYNEHLSSNTLQITQNDFLMLKSSVINDSLFSAKYLETVLENLTLMNYSEKKNIREHSYNFKQLVYYRQGRYSNLRSLFFLCFLIWLLALLTANKKNCLAIILNIIGTLIILGYFLYVNRLPAWVEDPVYLFSLFVACVEIASYTELELHVLKRFDNSKLKLILMLLLFVCFGERIFMYNDMVKKSYSDNDLAECIHYAEKTENVILFDNISCAPLPYIDVYGPLAYFEEGQWDNIIRVGNWDVEHPVRNAQKEALGIDSVIYSLAEGKSKLLTTEACATHKMYKTFFQEHYGINIEFDVERQFGKYTIESVRVVEE